jgi:hypothetical protein
MTIVPLRRGPRGGDGWRMDAHSLTLARLLLMAALTAATAEYVEVMKRRVVQRVGARERAMFEEHGLRGLVRVLLADAPAPERDA